MQYKFHFPWHYFSFLISSASFTWITHLSQICFIFQVSSYVGKICKIHSNAPSICNLKPNHSDTTKSHMEQREGTKPRACGMLPEALKATLVPPSAHPHISEQDKTLFFCTRLTQHSTCKLLGCPQVKGRLHLEVLPHRFSKPF